MSFYVNVRKVAEDLTKALNEAKEDKPEEIKSIIEKLETSLTFVKKEKTELEQKNKNLKASVQKKSRVIKGLNTQLERTMKIIEATKKECVELKNFKIKKPETLDISLIIAELQKIQKQLAVLEVKKAALPKPPKKVTPNIPPPLQPIVPKNTGAIKKTTIATKPSAPKVIRPVVTSSSNSLSEVKGPLVPSVEGLDNVFSNIYSTYPKYPGFTYQVDKELENKPFPKFNNLLFSDGSESSYNSLPPYVPRNNFSIFDSGYSNCPFEIPERSSVIPFYGPPAYENDEVFSFYTDDEESHLEEFGSSHDEMSQMGTIDSDDE